MKMTKTTTKTDKKEEYDVSDIITIEDKKKGDDFDLGRDELDAGDDDDELDFDSDFEFDDGGD
jgi:hypothetical protein